MIRIAHFSDLHYGTKNLAEADRCFGAAIDRAIALGAEAAVLSGDATDHGLDLHAPAAERLVAQVRRLADHCPVLMLQGTFSHEPPGTLAIFRLLGGRHPVHVADRIEQVALTAQGEWLASTSWCFDSLPAGARALFTCIPTVNKAVVAATVGAAEAAQAVGEHLALLLRGYAPIHRAARRQGVPTIGVSHGTVFGCVSEHGVPMAGFDHEFTTGALFGAEAQAFMLGHIHRHQAWEQESIAGRQCIAYPGSIGRFHYGEEGDKGFCSGKSTPTRRASRWSPRPRAELSISCSRANPTSTPCARLSRSRTSLARSCACAGPSPKKTATRSTARRSSGCWRERRKPSWKGASCPWCARGRQGSRNWRIWRTRCVYGRR
jgi:exonuclease SbcD